MALFGRAASQSSSVPATPDLTILCSKATNPQAEVENPNDIKEFCEAVNQLIDGPQQVVRIVVPKMQSLNEREAVYTLNLVEACVQSCGTLFHAEIGKFRFLNEMIKLLSPKYLGNTTPERVKKRTVELLYSWSKGLPHEPKIKEAYEMLKQQGLITSDPTYIDCHYDVGTTKSGEQAKVSVERHKNPIFEDEEKNKLLTKLLQSKNKDDLETANRLIKNMVKEDEEKIQKQYKRTEELETIHNNIRLLNDMINNYSKSSSQADVDLIKELKESLEKFRPRIFQLAAETDEKDESIGDILLASDDLASLLERYKVTVGNPDYIPPDHPKGDLSTSLVVGGTGGGLLDLQSSPRNTDSGSQLLSDQLTQLGIGESLSLSSCERNTNSNQSTNPFAIFDTLSPPSATASDTVLSTSPFNTTPAHPNDDLIGHTNPFNAVIHNQTTNFSNSFANSTYASPNPTAAARPLVYPHPVQTNITAIPPQLPQRPSPTVADLSKNISKKNNLSTTSQQQGASGGATAVGSNVNGTKGAEAAFDGLESLAKTWFSSSMGTSVASANSLSDSGDKVNQSECCSKPPTCTSPDVPLIHEMVSPLIDTSPCKTTADATNKSAKTSATSSRSHREDFIFYNIKPSATLKPMTLLSDTELGISITANFTTFSLSKSNSSSSGSVVGSDADRDLTDIVVLTISNNSDSNDYSNVSVQVACPKSMRTKVGSSSSHTLPPHAPFSPPSVVNLCIFIFNPNKVVPRLKFKVSMKRQQTKNDDGSFSPEVGNGEESRTMTDDEKIVNKVVDCSLDCLISESDLEFSDFN